MGIIQKLRDCEGCKRRRKKIRAFVDKAKRDLMRHRRTKK